MLPISGMTVLAAAHVPDPKGRNSFTIVYLFLLGINTLVRVFYYVCVGLVLMQDDKSPTLDKMNGRKPR
jgi:hypothetical protein